MPEKLYILPFFSFFLVCFFAFWTGNVNLVMLLRLMSNSASIFRSRAFVIYPDRIWSLRYLRRGSYITLHR